MKVLIAHGNTQRLKQAVTDLHAAGFDVVATPDGGDAFARFFEEMPEVVICSQVLPSLNGDNIARMVRAQSPETQMVLLVESESSVVEEGTKVIVEPMTLQKLREAMPDIAFEAPPALDEGDAGDLTAASPTRVFVHAVLKRFQRDNRALQSLDDAGIGRLAAIAENRNFQENENIIRQGDPGDGFYLVCEGQVRVTLAEKEDKEVARISAGGLFGEMAMLLDQKRSASVWSVEPTTLLWFGKELFMPILAEYPGMREVLSGVALKRTEENLWRVLFDDDEVQRSLAQLDQAVPDTPQATLPADKPVVKESITKTIRPSAVLAPAAELPKAQSPFDKWRFAIGLGVGFCAGVLVTLVLTPSPSAPPPSPLPKPQAAVSPAAVSPSSVAPIGAPSNAKVPGVQAASTPASQPASAPVVSAPEANDAPKPKMDAATAIAINDAYKASDFKKVLSLAKKAVVPDADSAYIIADARRQLGQPEALQAYLDFAASNPTHGRADDAQFWAADILSQQGKKDEARALFEKVAANEKSNFRTSAAKRLQP